MRVTIGIATTGRREIVSELLRELEGQTHLPERVVLCPAKDGDLDHDVGAGAPFPVDIVRGERGSSAQRNTILRASPDAEIVIFFDDDFVPAANFLEKCVACFQDNANVVGLTGCVIADGVKLPGYTLEDASKFLAEDSTPADEKLTDVFSLYGCNMALRMSAVRASGVVFDEMLPIYGWQEDVDFTRQIAAHGRVVRTQLCRGVHLGTKAWRTSGVRFGYSQIANPIYLVRKGTVSSGFAINLIGRNVLSNIGRFAFPEAWIDRAGRLRGNALAVADLFKGRLDPRNILDLT